VGAGSHRLGGTWEHGAPPGERLPLRWGKSNSSSQLLCQVMTNVGPVWLFH
jgi:hypothetical protein